MDATADSKLRISLVLVGLSVLFTVSVLIFLWYIGRQDSRRGESFRTPRIILGMDVDVKCSLGLAVYTVQAGDTCAGIAGAFRIPVELLTTANGIGNCDALAVGQSLCVPSTVAYSVQSGDTCYAISRAVGITVGDITRANQGLQCDNLQIGQKLILVRSSPYTVAKNDTFTTIAARFHLSVDVLRRANPKIDVDNLQIGETIILPSTMSTVVYPGATCFALAKLFGITVVDFQAINEITDCDGLMIGQIVYAATARPPAARCQSTAHPSPRASIPNVGIRGFWYLATDSGCVENSQTAIPTPSDATLSAYFENYIGDLRELDLSQAQYPCASEGGLTYNNYAMRAYTLGNGSMLWDDAHTTSIDAAFAASIKTAGYNTVIMDIERPISADQFNRIVGLLKAQGLTVMVYSFQYAQKAFAGDGYNFDACDYGIPSLYGLCNTATLCDGLAFWIQHFKSPARLLLGVIKDSWDTVRQYPFAGKTIGESGFAGYIEWNYNLHAGGQCKTVVQCDRPDPC